jgi:hypothetical protein
MISLGFVSAILGDKTFEEVVDLPVQTNLHVWR